MGQKGVGHAGAGHTGRGQTGVGHSGRHSAGGGADVSSAGAAITAAGVAAATGAGVVAVPGFHLSGGAEAAAAICVAVHLGCDDWEAARTTVATTTPSAMMQLMAALAEATALLCFSLSLSLSSGTFFKKTCIKTLFGMN